MRDFLPNVSPHDPAKDKQFMNDGLMYLHTWTLMYLMYFAYFAVQLMNMNIYTFRNKNDILK